MWRFNTGSSRLKFNGQEDADLYGMPPLFSHYIGFMGDSCLMLQAINVSFNVGKMSKMVPEKEILFIIVEFLRQNLNSRILWDGG